MKHQKAVATEFTKQDLIKASTKFGKGLYLEMCGHRGKTRVHLPYLIVPKEIKFSDRKIEYFPTPELLDVSFKNIKKVVANNVVIAERKRQHGKLIATGKGFTPAKIYQHHAS
ncbi:MAG: hypothetical protein LBV67_06320 [Streptococcaceae bacterium]|jgi:hypothetical protein|nr:hypothetical protein [Streptococcaceae bacterium]